MSCLFSLLKCSSITFNPLFVGICFLVAAVIPPLLPCGLTAESGAKKCALSLVRSKVTVVQGDEQLGLCNDL